MLLDLGLIHENSPLESYIKKFIVLIIGKISWYRFSKLFSGELILFASSKLSLQFPPIRFEVPSENFIFADFLSSFFFLGATELRVHSLQGGGTSFNSSIISNVIMLLFSTLRAPVDTPTVAQNKGN